MVISSEKGPWKQALTLNTTLKRHNNIGNGLCTLENVWKHVSCIYLSLIWIFDHFGQKWPWKHDLTLNTTLKRETNIRNGLLTPENIWNHIKHMTLTIIRRFSWSSGGHIGLVHTGHKGAWPLCLRWFLNFTYSGLTPCQVAKTCHHLHDSRKFRPGYNDNGYYLCGAFSTW